MRTLSNHRAAITTINIGQSSSSVNIAVSGAQDNTCIVWNYRSGNLLHTFLLPSSPLCLALDPAERAVYAGYKDGSIQLIDFFKHSQHTNPLHDPTLHSTPTQPSPSDRWLLAPEVSSAILCLDISYDGTHVVSGHQNGKVYTWNVAKGTYKQLADFAFPVTNLHMLPPTGFPNTPKVSLRIHNVVKPRYESSLYGSNIRSIGDVVPDNYTFTAQFTSTLSLPEYSSTGTSDALMSEFEAALAHPSFGLSLLEEGIAELANLSSTRTTILSTSSLDSNAEGEDSELAKLHLEIHNLRAEANHARAMQTSSQDKVLELEDVLSRKRVEETVKKMAKKRRRLRRMKADEIKRKIFMGEEVGSGDEGMNEEDDEGEGLSSSSDELMQSD